jgi:adenosine/AMP kinase
VQFISDDRLPAEEVSKLADIHEVEIAVPDGFQLVIGQSHFIKTVEDVFETLVTSMPGIRFGVAFCESSGKALIRYDGTSGEATGMAKEFAEKLSAGHVFVVVLEGAYPINVLNRIKMVEEVAGVYCATANKVTVIVADTVAGRAILGVADGVRSKGVENEADREERHRFLRDIGYKK